MTRFTLVVPVYNAEETINRLLTSILAQTYKNYQVILVNDGSADKSGEICDAYAEKYTNIRTVHKDNGGLCAARNQGMALAQGEYTIFLDSDDYVEPEMLSGWNEIIIKQNPDCIISGFKRRNIDTGQEKIFQAKQAGLCRFTEEEGALFGNLYCEYLLTSAWAKAFKTKVIMENQIQYKEEMLFGEDEYFCMDFFTYSQSNYIDSNSYYIYIKSENPNALTNKTIDFNFYNILYERVQQFCESRNIWGENESCVATMYLRAVLNHIEILKSKKDKSLINYKVIEVSEPMSNKQKMARILLRIPAVRCMLLLKINSF
ncbi:glycosyltransferase family 2 protein [Listeria booriae]|uniref:glycosyltransferase family 2 protein n=1 Tax=Listeria booriae TaxID=1552123 RepID=UPI00162634BB|nr:glycosyltransferase family A protein [Listeria booriae]MBC1211355.1 glycosyltransferase family 2 protein [Listeria booriae]MBC2391724.1 glycosyltransferase family 2 protein [Listeria booriae]